MNTVNDVEDVLLTFVCAEGAEDADALAEGAAWLSEYRMRNIARFANARDRALSVYAELALLLCAMDRDPSFVPPALYAADARGKIGFLSPDMGFLSISHAGFVAVCAHAARIPLGVDVERRDRNFRMLSRRMLSPTERALPIAADALPRIWCAKESYLKLTGEGLSGGMENLTLTGDCLFDARTRREAHMAYFDFDEYACAVCADAPVSLRVQMVSFADAFARVLGRVSQ